MGESGEENVQTEIVFFPSIGLPGFSGRGGIPVFPLLHLGGGGGVKAHHSRASTLAEVFPDQI
ncbi:hypothetical protein ZHAS_00021424 [Anopheles sinensis]|uniref:Uncharacterized protein n=1 Tax=Anopheles sinensis TaxID=74873 RepID=A0A084WSD6_ANOSI|nr:hypothetical protein ZHAS_00021424 [Anopheles sinensis]